ncbi:MAG: hypothetical protein KFF50_06310 [Desulfatitalea sp.]|nr:hypothetical protein [Desulfatitalea sp.]
MVLAHFYDRIACRYQLRLPDGNAPHGAGPPDRLPDAGLAAVWRHHSRQVQRLEIWLQGRSADRTA